MPESFGFRRDQHVEMVTPVQEQRKRNSQQTHQELQEGDEAIGDATAVMVLGGTLPSGDDVTAEAQPGHERG